MVFESLNTSLIISVVKNCLIEKEINTCNGFIQVSFQHVVLCNI